MKKLASLLLALVMIMSCFSAMAEATETPTTYTIKINNAKAGHVYAAYQIFAGKLHDKDTTADTKNDAVLSDVDWGTGVNGDAILNELQSNSAFMIGEGENKVNAFAECESAADVADVLSNNTGFVVDFASVVGANLKEPTGTSTAVDGGYEIEVPEGYYLVKNTTVPEDDAHTRFIIEVVEDSIVSPKASVPSSEKKVKDTNDTTGETSNWQDSADYDIGDDVQFQLKATIGSTYADYDAYYLAFHDTQSAGLSFKADTVKVYVNNVLIENTADTEYYKVITTGLTDGCTFEVEFLNLKKIESVKADSVITVEYASTLTDAAVTGSAGNTNKMQLEFSNNPNSNWDGTTVPGDDETGETPEDTVIVFTYEVDVNKIAENDEALTGAAFTLYKWEKDAQVDENDANTAGSNTDTPVHKDAGAWVVVKAIDADPATSQFVFNGLDDGDYKLVETKAPAGYNLLLSPIYFTITADHEITSTTIPMLTKLNSNGVLTGEFELNAEKTNSTNGILSTNVENKAGATLPETGGMGTTILYVGGGILVLAAIVLLIVKRRANAE